MGEIERIVEDVYPACALLAGTKLDLFTPMAERPRSGAELAEELVAVRAGSPSACRDASVNRGHGSGIAPSRPVDAALYCRRR